MTDYIPEGCPPDDPHRCQGKTEKGQCPRKAMPISEGNWSNYCSMHGGVSGLQANEKKNARNYRLAKWSERINEKSDSSNIKSLREEIGVLRLLLEERLDHCESNMDLLLHSGPISNLVRDIERVVSSCHRLEGSMGQLLDKTTLLQFVQGIIAIITDLIDDEEIINEIASRIEVLLSDSVAVRIPQQGIPQAG